MGLTLLSLRTEGDHLPIGQADLIPHLGVGVGSTVRPPHGHLRRVLDVGEESGHFELDVFTVWRGGWVGGWMGGWVRR